MAGSAKCDFSVAQQRANPATRPVMIASAKCDFSIIADGLAVTRDRQGAISRADVVDSLGSIRSASSKCDWKFQAEDILDRFSLTGRLSSSKCDFSVMVDFGLRGGQQYRAAAAASSKCDFTFSRFEKISKPDRK